MPYVSIQVTPKNVTRESKAALVRGVTELLRQVLDKDPAHTFVVVDVVPNENWGEAGELIPPDR
ncbi:MAG TPA: 4-oxalocrotonate tautomerase family protein [Holophagaceae bacterium]|nr:4-oxalocrotonate tautomerase family protein [Holophagaceae bacterium]